MDIEPHRSSFESALTLQDDCPLPNKGEQEGGLHVQQWAIPLKTRVAVTTLGLSMCPDSLEWDGKGTGSWSAQNWPQGQAGQGCVHVFAIHIR